jgi:hypothetical protein
LALTPLAFRGLKWARWLAIPVAALAGIGNGLAHIVSSIYLGRFMPGVYSAPLILLSGTLLLRSALGKDKGRDDVMRQTVEGRASRPSSSVGMFAVVPLRAGTPGSPPARSKS